MRPATTAMAAATTAAAAMAAAAAVTVAKSLSIPTARPRCAASSSSRPSARRASAVPRALTLRVRQMTNARAGWTTFQPSMFHAAAWPQPRMSYRRRGACALAAVARSSLTTPQPRTSNAQRARRGGAKRQQRQMTSARVGLWTRSWDERVRPSSHRRRSRSPACEPGGSLLFELLFLVLLHVSVGS